MKKSETVLRDLKDRINSILEKLERRNEDYTPVETEFELAMNDKDNPESILEFLNPNKFVQEVESAISELRTDKKAQESYLLYTYGSLVTAIDTWCYRFGNPGNYAADLMLKEMEDFQKTVYFKTSKSKKIEQKKEGIYVKPIEPSSAIFDQIELFEKESDSTFEVSEESMKPYLAISELVKRKILSIKENFDYKSEYRATQLYIQINEYEKELKQKNNPYIRTFFQFWRKPTPNEIQLMNAFWEIVERLDEAEIFQKLKKELAPENVIRNFLEEKIHFTVIEGESKNRYDTFSITQKILLVKALGIEGHLISSGMNQAVYSKVFSKIIGCSPKTIENNLNNYKPKLYRKGSQIQKDHKIVDDFLEKNKLKDLAGVKI